MSGQAFVSSFICRKPLKQTDLLNSCWKLSTWSWMYRLLEMLHKRPKSQHRLFKRKYKYHNMVRTHSHDVTAGQILTEIANILRGNLSTLLGCDGLKGFVGPNQNHCLLKQRFPKLFCTEDWSVGVSHYCWLVLPHHHWRIIQISEWNVWMNYCLETSPDYIWMTKVKGHQVTRPGVGDPCAKVPNKWLWS